MKKLLLIGIWFMMSACDHQPYFKKDIIEELAKKHADNFTVHRSLKLFVAVENNQIATTDAGLLSTMYKYDYSNQYSSFEQFLFDALNQRITFPAKYIIKRNGSVFSISEKIKMEYDHYGLDSLRKYARKEGKVLTIPSSSSVDPNEMMTVLYYFFINNYAISFDDYIGQFRIRDYKTYMDDLYNLFKKR